jgi:outer membrane murein-binding lipoprotein Lpp
MLRKLTLTAVAIATLALAGCGADTPDTPTPDDVSVERTEADLAKRFKAENVKCTDVAKDRQECVGFASGEARSWSVALDLATGLRTYTETTP